MNKIKKIFNNHPNIIALVLLSIMAVCAITSMAGDSAIVDEIAHIPAGYSYLKYGDYRLNPEHPPLIKDLAGLPLQFMNLKFPEKHSTWTQDVNGQWEAGWHFIYHIGNDADNIIFWARIPMVLVMLLLGFYLYRASREWFGEKEALLALALFAFCPNIIAHGRFVTTDVGAAAFIFISIYYFLKWITHPLPTSPSEKGRNAKNSKNILKASIALALAQLAKFSAVLLIPAFLIIVFVYTIAKIIQNYKTEKQCSAFAVIWRYFGGLLAIFISAFILIGVFYLPHTKNMPVDKIYAQIDTGLPSEKVKSINNLLKKMASNPILKPHSYYLTGFAMVVGRVAGGNTTFFLGKVTNQSFRAYFPVVYLAKTPLATLILTATAIIMALISTIFALKPLILGKWKKMLFDFFHYILEKIHILTALLFIFIYAYTSITGNLNIGFRHLIPILPFIFMLVGYEIIKIFKKTKSKHHKVFELVLCGLILWLIGANICIYPHYAAYFNEAAGGPKNGYKIVTDSNVDWGQDLKRLGQWVEKNKIENIKVDYFGGGSSKYYFCKRTINPSLIGEESLAENKAYDCRNSFYEEWHANNGETSGWIAVSATFLQNSLWNKQQFGEKDYEWLRQREPDAMIGYSILMYKIE
ncbi:MAG: glycosyltransferase family 39 protein [bacterium]